MHLFARHQFVNGRRAYWVIRHIIVEGWRDFWKCESVVPFTRAPQKTDVFRIRSNIVTDPLQPLITNLNALSPVAVLLSPSFYCFRHTQRNVLQTSLDTHIGFYLFALKLSKLDQFNWLCLYQLRSASDYQFIEVNTLKL